MAKQPKSKAGNDGVKSSNLAPGSGVLLRHGESITMSQNGFPEKAFEAHDGIGAFWDYHFVLSFFQLDVSGQSAFQLDLRFPVECFMSFVWVHLAPGAAYNKHALTWRRDWGRTAPDQRRIATSSTPRGYASFRASAISMNSVGSTTSIGAFDADPSRLTEIAAGRLGRVDLAGVLTVHIPTTSLLRVVDDLQPFANEMHEVVMRRMAR